MVYVVHSWEDVPSECVAAAAKEITPCLARIAAISPELIFILVNSFSMISASASRGRTGLPGGPIAFVGTRWDKSFFSVELDSPFTREKWALPVSSRRSLPGRLPGLLYRVRQGLFCVIRAAYVDSLDVLGMFFHRHGEPLCTPVYLDGTHRYIYKSTQDRQLHVVMASADLKESWQTQSHQPAVHWV